MKCCLLYLLPLLLCCLLSATAYTQLQKIYLQPKAVAREKQSKYIDSIRFIPLEAKEDIELGAYYNIQVAKKYLLLIDYTNKRLILYTPDGHFIKSISYKNLGGDFYPAYQERNNRITFFGNNKNYALTPKDRIKIKLDWGNPHNKKYFKKYTLDLSDSSFTIKKDLPEERDILGVYHYYDDYYLQAQITTSPLYKDSLDYELKLYKSNELAKAFFPYNRITEPRYLYIEENVASYKIDTSPNRIIIRPFCDTIYKLVKDSLFPAYQLVLPLENSLPASFFSKPFKNKTERDNFYRNNGWSLRKVSNFYESPRFIFFSVSYLSNYGSYIYEKGTGSTYNAKNIKVDSSQYNLSLIADYGTQKFGNQFYKPLRASDLLPFFEKNKNVPIPKELEAFIASKPPGASPVIAVFNFKN